MKKSIKSLLLLTSFLSMPYQCYAQIKDVAIQDEHVTQYSKVELDVSLIAQWKSPYDSNDVALDMEIRSPSGKKYTLPCFFSVGQSKKLSHWKAHFAPKEVGAYTVKFALKDNGRLINTSEPLSFSVFTSVKPGFLSVNDLWTLKFDNGELFRGIGENFGWENRANDDSKFFKTLHENPRFNYENILPKLHSQGVNFIRTWMIDWNLPIDWRITNNSNRYSNSTERFNPSGIKRMDELIAIAEKNDIYIMMAMDSHAGFIGESWERNNYNIKNGGFAHNPAEFFSNPKSRQQYKDKLRFLVARWGYSPNVAAWEFFNEIDNVIHAKSNLEKIPDSLITDWHKEMSDYLVSIDPYSHIITTSISHRDVAGLNDLPNLHINQKHVYKATEKIPEALAAYSTQHNKPYVIGEFGYEWDWSKNFDELQSGMESDFKRGLWFGLFSPTPITPMTWWWEYFDEKGTTAYFAKVSEINSLMLSTATANLRALDISSNNKLVTVLGVDNGVKQFIYLYNSGDAAAQISLNIKNSVRAPIKNIQVFNCEEGTYSQMSVDKKDSLDEISVAAKTDLILITN
jgi:hypothetical protein